LIEPSRHHGTKEKFPSRGGASADRRIQQTKLSGDLPESRYVLLANQKILLRAFTPLWLKFLQ
jgi:hypothetical protein